MSRLQMSHGRFVALVIGLLAAALALFGVLIVQDFNRALEPELERRSELIGTTVQDDVERALELGIPLHALVGMEPYVDTLIEDFAELDYVVVRDRDGTALHTGGDPPDAVLDERFWVSPSGSREVAGSIATRYGVATPEALAGNIDVGVDGGFVRSRLEDLALDLVVIILVALVVGYEIALSTGERVAGRRRRSSGVADIRLILFVFVVAEELSKSFLPQLTLGATDPDALLDPAVAVSLPIVAYLLTLGLASPFAGRLATSLGQRRLLLLGFAVAAASHLGMVFAETAWQITLLRGLTGVGYALSTVASLEYLIERSPGSDRMRAMTTFVFIVIGGTFAGTALGGILADRLGYRPVFAVSVILVAAAALLAWRLLSGTRRGSVAEDPGAFTSRDIRAVLRQPRLLALLAGVTVPMNVLLAAFLWYLVPLTLAAAGDSPSVIGRTLMLYYLAVLVAGPIVGRLGGTHITTPTLVGFGALVSGLALLIPSAGVTTMSVSIAVVVVGLGHAAIRGPQLSLAIELGEGGGAGAGRGATLAAMRTLERLGSLAGLLLAALVAARTDLVTAMAVLAISVTLAGAAYLGVVLVVRRRAQHA